MSLTIHAVPFNSTALTAECGQRLGGNGHTGHFRPLRAFDDAVVCEACQPTTTDARVSAALDAAQQGMAAATDHADPRLVLAVDAKIAEFNATGEPWSANDLRDELPVSHGPLIGARINAAALRRPREMRRVGMTRSTLLSTRGAWLAVWEGVR